jgi:hypothetical protein
LVKITSVSISSDSDNFFLDGEEETSVREQERGEVVFSDAKKQFLMESLPLILTLNLKRFVQHGRRLQKNSRHISFPTLLDMAPFSTNSCKVKIVNGTCTIHARS